MFLSPSSCGPQMPQSPEVQWSYAPDVFKLGDWPVISFDCLKQDDRGATYTICPDFFENCRFGDLKYGTISARSTKGRGDHWHYHAERLSASNGGDSQSC
jgi:hypothetical protein